MSEDKALVVELKYLDKDEPEEGEIQDDDDGGGSLEDVSSGEDMSSTFPKRNCDNSYYDNKFTVPHIVNPEYVSHSSLSHKTRVPKTCEHKTRRFSASVEDGQSRLNVGKYREETNKPNSEVYHVRLNTVVLDDRRREDTRFPDMLQDYKIIRPKQSVKDEDIVQEKENRHDCRKDAKAKRKCRRKRRHSVLNDPEPRPSLSSDSKIGNIIGSKKLTLGDDTKKKKESFTKLETKSKNSHSKKRIISPKREKRRCSKKRGSKKLLGKKVTNTIVKSNSSNVGAQGNSLLKRLQTMMATDVSVRQENTIVEREGKINALLHQDVELGLKKKLCCVIPASETGESCVENNENTIKESSPEEVEILKETKENSLPLQSSLDVQILPEILKLNPVVITIEDSDSEPQSSVEVVGNETVEETNKKDERKITEGKTSGPDDEDEDLVHLRLLALQSNRRKETSMPVVEDDEVMQLRLAALKSAILKKCQVRKQRGATLKSKKMNDLDSNILDIPFPLTLEQPVKCHSTKDDSREESWRMSSETTLTETFLNEPDETTTLVDMDLSHTDDESNAQNDIIIEPLSEVIPLPEESAGSSLQLVEEDYNTQNISCVNDSLLDVSTDEIIDLEQQQKKNDVVPTWNPAVLYESPEISKFNLESGQLPEMFSSDIQVPSLHSVGYSNSQPSFPSSQHLYHDFCENNSGLPNADLDGVPLDAIRSSFDSNTSTAIDSSFVSSNINSPGISEAFSVSGAEPPVYSSNSFISRIESPVLNSDSTKPNVELQVSKINSVTSTNETLISISNSLFHRPETQVIGTNLFIHRPDSHLTRELTSLTCQNMETKHSKSEDLHTKYCASCKETLHASPEESIDMSKSGSISVFPINAVFDSAVLDPQIHKLESVNVSHESPDVSVTVKESVGKSENSVEVNPGESENIDLSNMIVLDEVGLCSSPEVKVEDIFNGQVIFKRESSSDIKQQDQFLGSLDEDEETLRAKVLTTLARNSSRSTAALSCVPINDNISLMPEISFSQNTKASNKSSNSRTALLSPNDGPLRRINNSKTVQITSTKRTTPIKLSTSLYQLKGSAKISQKLYDKKIDHSHSNSVTNSSKGNVLSGKSWKKYAKNMKQILTKVNKNSLILKQLPGHSVTSSDSRSSDMEPKYSTSHCNSSGSPISRVVFGSRLQTSTTLQVTVPAKNADDERCRRTVAEGCISSITNLHPSKRFVIRLGEDSDSPDEEDKCLQVIQTPKRRYVLKNNSSSTRESLLTVPTSSSRVGVYDSKKNSDCSLTPSYSQVDGSLSDNQNKTPKSSVSVDFEKSVDIFLKQARKSQEAKTKTVAQQTSATNKSLEGKSTSVSSVTPLAVRHLPSSQQEEYRRLKRQIAELEEQRKQCQLQTLSKNAVICTKSASLPSSPVRTTVIGGNVKSQLKISPVKSDAEKKTVSLNNIISIRHESNLKKILSQHSRRKSQDMKKMTNDNVSVASKTLFENNSFTVVPAVGALHTATEHDIQNISTAAMSLQQKPKEQQGRVVDNAKNLDSEISSKEVSVVEPEKHVPLMNSSYEVITVHKLSQIECDEMLNAETSVMVSTEEKKEKLADIELQLLSKRNDVLDDLTNMTTLLSQIELERNTENACLAELRRLRAELRLAEDRHAQQKELLSNMRINIAESRRRVAKGRLECIDISKICQSLGISVKGRHYKVPSAGAEQMNEKLQQVASQTRRMFRKKDLEDGEEISAGNEVCSPFVQLEMPVQDKTSAVERPKVNAGISNKICSSAVVNDGRDLHSNKVAAIHSDENSQTLIYKTNLMSQPNYASSSETLQCELLKEPDFSSKLPTPSSVTVESENGIHSVLELDNHVSVSSEDHKNSEIDKDQVSDSDVNNIKRISTGESEELCSDSNIVAVMGSDNSRMQIMPQHITEYKSPLEYFHSKRQGIVHER